MKINEWTTTSEPAGLRRTTRPEDLISGPPRLPVRWISPPTIFSTIGAENYLKFRFHPQKKKYIVHSPIFQELERNNKKVGPNQNM